MLTTPAAGENSEVQPDSHSAREKMIDRQLRARGIFDRAVLDAFMRVPRERFVPSGSEREAYEDHPIAIGCSQTISQPYIVAAMMQAAQLRPEDRVLEIGTGSGYSTALLAEVVREVITVERFPELANVARERLSEMGYANVEIAVGDGSLGYAPRAPYDAILVAAAAPSAPAALVEQLAVGGRMIVPVGDLYSQDLVLVRREEDGLRQIKLDGCMFVPLIGQQGFKSC